MKRYVPALALLAAALGFASCSSAPKAPDGIYLRRNETVRYIELAAKSAREGLRSEAILFYEEAYRLATSVDDARSRVSALDGLATVYASDVAVVQDAVPSAEASGIVAPASSWGAPKDAPSCRKLAASVAAASLSAELVAWAEILEAEAALKSGSDGDALRAAALAESSSAALDGKSAERARALRALGSARKALGDSSGALSALDEAASIDRKRKRFTELAADRYLAASVHSKLGDYPAARTALLDALENDRRAENAAGIGADYRALAMISEKAGDAGAAIAYYQAARDVFAAGRFAADAADAEARLAALRGSEAPEAGK